MNLQPSQVIKYLLNQDYLLATLYSCIPRIIYHKKIWISSKTYLKGLRNILTDSDLVIGLNHVPFYQKRAETYIHVEGSLIIKERSSVSRGAVLEIGKSAQVTLQGCSIGASKFLIHHSLEIGSGTLISWGCQFLDNNIHHVIIDGTKESKKAGIKIGDRCWIGSNCTILPDVVIPNGCVVATGSIVTKAFTQENCLIAGSPAKVIKTDISWEP